MPVTLSKRPVGLQSLAAARQICYAEFTKKGVPVKITVEHVPAGVSEVVLRCPELDQEMLWVLSMLRSGLQKLCVWGKTREAVFLLPGEVVYCDSVEERTFVYIAQTVYQTALSLAELEGRYGDLGFFRVSKGAVVNLHRIRSLKSQPGNRIEATLETGEKLNQRLKDYQTREG